MQSLVFGLRNINSAYYSLWKWDHLQINRFFVGSKTIYSGTPLIRTPLIRAPQLSGQQT